MAFPTHRPRRLRRSEAIRTLVRETRLTASSLIYPLFVCPGSKVKDEIKSMPGNYRWSVDLLVDECRAAYDLGIPAVILFASRKRRTRWVPAPTIPKASCSARFGR
jgi:porphobilinogen synthase